ncbi:MAG: SGNH/GDSL hydrolase family protein, partial [Verrucomicrobiota bacterium]
MSSLVSFLLTFSLLLAVPSLMAQDGPGKAKAKRPNPAMVPVEDIPGLPRVLLIGDSISIGYTLPTREALAGIANVHRPRANCGPTTSGLANLAEWLKTGGEEKNWDVIHFNWGLHDLKYMGPNGENLADPDAADSAQQVPPDEYRENLETLVGQLLE